ncbi:cytochrome b N-terminal domain-containing protein [Streptococcus uberis]
MCNYLNIKSSVSNPLIQRFFALHYLVPFIIAAMVIMHLMALHIHGSSNPLGITGNLDRIPMHSYFIFKDLVTVFLFMLILALFVFYSPNTLGQNMALLLITYVINILCAVCWKSLFIKYQ